MSGATVMRMPLPLPTRQEAMRFAIASTVMEGQTVSADMEQILSEWAGGGMSDEELIRRSLLPEMRLHERL